MYGVCGFVVDVCFDCDEFVVECVWWCVVCDVCVLCVFVDVRDEPSAFVGVSVFGDV